MQSLIEGVKFKAVTANSNARSLQQIITDATEAGLADKAFRDITDPFIPKTEAIMNKTKYVMVRVSALKVTDPNFRRDIMLLDLRVHEDFIRSKDDLDETLKAFADAKETKKRKKEEEAAYEAIRKKSKEQEEA